MQIVCGLSISSCFGIVIATPDAALHVHQMAESARTLTPGIEIILRTHNEEECDLMREAGMGAVFYGEDELAKGMTRHVLARFAPQG